MDALPVACTPSCSMQLFFCSFVVPPYVMMLGSKGLLPPTDAHELLRSKLLPQFCKHSESVDLLRKSLLPHVWRVPSSKALSCKHERLFDLLTLASCHVPCVEMNGSTSTLPSSIINILVHFVSKILAFFVSVVIFYAACS